MSFGPNSIFGQLDGIAADAQGLQDVSDAQAGNMHSLANTLQGLAATLQGSAGTAMQQVGEQMHAAGMRISSQFADHSQKMQNNGHVLDTTDADNMHVITQVGNLTV